MVSLMPKKKFNVNKKIIVNGKIQNQMVKKIREQNLQTPDNWISGRDVVQIFGIRSNWYPMHY